MTKYILESGNYKHYPEKMRAFINEALAGLGSSPKILWCFFASESEERDERFNEFIELTKGMYPEGVVPIHKEAIEEAFVVQVKEADLVNIQGGHTKTLKKSLEQFALTEIFEGKVVAGHSAGANIIGESYWSPGAREFGEGFGLLPIKFLSHYKSDYGIDDPRGPIDWNKAKADLEAYGDTSLPVYALEEGEFAALKI